MKILGVGWFLIIILAVLQYNIKKERLHTLALQKNSIESDENRDNTRLIIDKEDMNHRHCSEWSSIHSCLKSLERKTSEHEY